MVKKWIDKDDLGQELIKVALKKGDAMDFIWWLNEITSHYDKVLDIDINDEDQVRELSEDVWAEVEEVEKNKGRMIDSKLDEFKSYLTDLGHDDEAIDGYCKEARSVLVNEWYSDVYYDPSLSEPAWSWQPIEEAFEEMKIRDLTPELLLSIVQYEDIVRSNKRETK